MADSPKGILEQQTTHANLSSQELRVLLDDYVVQFAGQVEEAADQIIAAAEDAVIRRHALLWKINGISACFQAASRKDPLAAYMDIWILNKQSIAMFERSALFGSRQSLAVETAHRLEGPLHQIQTTIGADFPIREDFAIAFARDYPVQTLYFARESVAARYTEYLDVIQAPRRELRDVVGGLDGRLDQLHRLAALYAEFLPKQARWQSELMLLESIPQHAIAQPLADLSVASSAIARIADTAASIPSLAEREREYLLTAVREERVETLQAVDRMREETMAQLRHERIAVLDALRNERSVTSQEITDYLNGTFEKTASSAQREWETLARRGEHLTDHVFKRFVQILTGTAALALTMWILLRSGRTQPRLRSPPMVCAVVSRPPDRSRDGKEAA